MSQRETWREAKVPETFQDFYLRFGSTVSVVSLDPLVFLSEHQRNFDVDSVNEVY